MSRIVLATAGSLGDLHPYLAVGLGLKARGHDVGIATVGFYRSKVEALGLGFHPIRPDIAPAAYRPEVFRRANDLRTGTQYLLKEMVLPAVQETYEDLIAACQGADLFVSHPILFPAPVVAESLGIKWISVVLAPGAFVSAYDPPVLPPFPWLHVLRHLGPLPNALMYRLLARITRGWMKPIDELRARVGLPPAAKHPLHADMFSALGTLAWFSAVLGSPQPDWPARSQTTGFVFYDETENGHGMDGALTDFLNAGAPPVVFTLGTSAVLDPGEFFEHSLDATHRIGCRAVFLVGAGLRDRLKSPQPKTVFVTDYAPYSQLFRKAAAVVHQGGIGTTAQALRAGVPMIVTPFLHDQPDNAFRVARLGVARVLSRARYNGERAATHLTAILARQDYDTRAKRLAERIQTEDGINCACAALERHAV